MTTYAKVVADSIFNKRRATSMEVRLHRFVLAELNTHRMLAGRNADDLLVMEEFSRNSASSRAIPLRKQIEKVRTDPAIPVSWPREQKGMQGGEELSQQEAQQARYTWLDASLRAREYAEFLGNKGVHKSVANRLLEPFLWHTVVITATNWEGFWEQRCSPLAQPEIKVAAEAMKAAYDASTPVEKQVGEWHLPYIDDSDIEATREHLRVPMPTVEPSESEVTKILVRMSTARCARTSYETQDGKRSIPDDLSLYGKLVSATPAHWSPLEHPCTPWPENSFTHYLTFTHLGGQRVNREVTRPRVGNLLGWRQHRFEMEVA